MDRQLELFDSPKCKIDKKIRLIELFGGIGTQAMALRDIGADFEHYRLVEFDKYAVASYNAIHGTNFKTMDIKSVHGVDLGIERCDEFTYLLTYSFPCQSLSVAGKMEGMSRKEWKEGKGTRSGLLWEVERILEECNELPQILLMENVPQVHGKKNLADFNKWIDFLKSKGYQNFWQDLNARDYGIPQNRVRCFMVSILSDGYVGYEFPKPVELKTVMKDYLEDSVDEKYYIYSEKAQKLIAELIERGELPQTTDNRQQTRQDKTRQDKTRQLLQHKKECQVVVLGNMDNTIDHTFESANRVYDKNNLCPTIPTCAGGGIQPKIIEETKCCVAMRGRNPDNPSDRTRGAKMEQRLEMNKDGLVNTLTTVQKDNLVLEQNEFFNQAIKTAEEGNAEPGDIIDAFNKKVIKSGISPTITTRPEGKKTAILPCVEIKQATKEGFIQCKVGGCYDASYPESKTRRGRVQEGGDVTSTITAQGGENINYVEEIINEEEKGIREVLFFLRSEIGEKSFSEWTIRGLYCFLKKEILQQKLYAEIILENWKESAELEQFTYNSKGNKSIITSEEELRDMWKDWKNRCTPYRRKLSEQQNRKLDDFMQKLSHKDTQAEEIVFYLWETSKGIRILRKTLSEIQEIWESFNDKQRSRTSYRIRKLTPREVWRLMGYTDEDFEKASAVNSNTQLYKEAGNAIVKQVLMAIFSQMNIKGVKPWNDMTLKEKNKSIQKSTSEKKSKNN